MNDPENIMGRECVLYTLDGEKPATCVKAYMDDRRHVAVIESADGLHAMPVLYGWAAYKFESRNEVVFYAC